MNSIQLEENISRVSDILEQISKLNEMVDFHKNESKELRDAESTTVCFQL